LIQRGAPAWPATRASLPPRKRPPHETDRLRADDEPDQSTWAPPGPGAASEIREGSRTAVISSRRAQRQPDRRPGRDEPRFC
jgi:hypothetical protein